MDDETASAPTDDPAAGRPVLPYAADRHTEPRARMADWAGRCTGLAVLCGLATVLLFCAGVGFAGAGHGTYAVLYASFVTAALTFVSGVTGFAFYDLDR